MNRIFHFSVNDIFSITTHWCLMNDNLSPRRCAPKKTAQNANFDDIFFEKSYNSLREINFCLDVVHITKERHIEQL